MSKEESFFLGLSNEIPGIKPGKMFGALCMKTAQGKSAAMFWRNNIVVKLNEVQMGEAMKLKGSKLFEPMERKAMKEWLQIPFEYKDQWKNYVLLSIINADAARVKPSKKK